MSTRILTVIAIAALSACTSVPERNSSLDRAQGAFAAAQSDPQINSLAAAELKQAGDALAQAQQAFDNRQPESTVNHLSYMANQRVVIAKEIASTKAAQAVTAGAGAERDAMRLAERNAEIERTREKLAMSEAANVMKSNALAQADATASQAQQRADEAQARAQALSAQLQSLNAQRTERGMVVTLSDVLFESGQARLLHANADNLRRLADALKTNGGLTASVEGYTDSVGSDATNNALSARRARAVVDALVAMGVRPEQLSVHGNGEANPVASNDTAAGRQMNRRVEIVFAPQAGLISSK